MHKITTVIKTYDKEDLSKIITPSPYYLIFPKTWKVVFKRTMDFVTKSSILHDKLFEFRQNTQRL